MLSPHVLPLGKHDLQRPESVITPYAQHCPQALVYLLLFPRLILESPVVRHLGLGSCGFENAVSCLVLRPRCVSLSGKPALSHVQLFTKENVKARRSSYSLLPESQYGDDPAASLTERKRRPYF